MNLELKIPPLLLTIVMMAMMWIAASVVPSLTLSFPGQGVIGWMIVLGGMICVGLGVWVFRRVKTTVNPIRPEQASVFVTTGIYAISRNPMYLGFLLILIGWGVYLGNAVVLLIFPLAFVLYMNRFQIGPEERALEAIFTDEYVRYRRNVRRWL